MRDTIKESISETIQDLTDLGIKTSFTEKELNELGIGFQEPEITAEAVKEIRGKTHLSQSVFARLLNVSLSSVRQWEQGKRTPTGSAKILLDLLRKEPHILDYRIKGQH
jgi:putative transcriptional regulator